MPLIGNELKQLTKSVLIPLELTTAVSATHAAIHEKRFRSDNRTLTISIEEMNDIMKIIKSLEESGLSTKDASKKIKNEAKEQKDEFLSMLLGTLSASLLGNLLAGRGKIRADGGTITAAEGTIRADQGF